MYLLECNKYGFCVMHRRCNRKRKSKKSTSVEQLSVSTTNVCLSSPRCVNNSIKTYGRIHVKEIMVVQLLSMKMFQCFNVVLLCVKVYNLTNGNFLKTVKSSIKQVYLKIKKFQKHSCDCDVVLVLETNSCNSVNMIQVHSASSIVPSHYCVNTPSAVTPGKS